MERYSSTGRCSERGNHVINHTISAKRIFLTGLAAVVITVLAGCQQSWVPCIGHYPLGPNKLKNEAITEYESERHGRDVLELRDFNLKMGKEPYDDMMIPLLSYRQY